MKSAIRDIRGGAKLRPTAALYGIPVMTLSDYSKRDSYDLSFRMGRKPVFSREQETEIRDQILLLASMFYGLTPQSLKAAVFTYAESNKIKNPFNKDKKEAGKDWMYGFLKRNPEISIRRPEPTSVNRILAFNATEVQIFFDNLSSTYDKYRFRPHRIFNVDETGINAVHKRDNHSSHISVRIYDFCRQNGIIMLTIPPHTSHRTQPLDITVYSPLKTALHKECDAYMKLHQYEKLTPLQLIPLFTQAYLNVANAEKALSGFRASGIWPFNPNVFSQLIQEGNDNASDRISTEQAIVDIRMESEMWKHHLLY
ncbi:unnamed protein product [Acanthoscelides obtectus]|uniref:DDE-1 domain-containing protein n=1 Tax=Acanthoscelides obtectus TaxID=200917 RepID=A0A9P0M369_ACAOB|nr:unnamed protein product [Acanthoscelides obtectus]CAK1656482.1 hypothetical protein AOBTE_LOCUS19737 [Acanthoscelides obtectus]